MPRRLTFLKATPAVPILKSAEQAERDLFYGSASWKRCRDAFLKVSPLCELCQAEDRLVVAVVVHHRVERLDDPDLAFSHENMQGLCKSHHTTIHKTRPSK
jgi:5-methylcytosine-specific restriction protein A